MLNKVGGVAGWIADRIPALLTLALLASLGIWGARNDWKVPALGGVADPEEKEKEKTESVKVVRDKTFGEAKSLLSDPPRIEFPSADLVRASGIESDSVKTRHMAQFVTANGMLDYEPYRYAQLAPRAAGTVWWVEKELGEPVHRGEVLALIDSTDVGRAKADFLQSLELVELRRASLDRLQSAQGAVSGGNLREAQANLREARLRLFNDHQRLLNLNLPFRVEDVAKLPEDQQVKHMRLLGLPEKLQKQVNPETLTANLLPLTAPFDGRLVRHPHAAPGEVVGTNQPLFAVGDTTRLHIDLEINPPDAGLLRVGQTVTFVAADRPGEKTGKEARAAGAPKGKLSHISPEVNEKSRRIQVHAELENPDERLRPNTYGTGYILVREKPDAVAVATEAIQWEIEKEVSSPYVFVRVSETVFHVRPVQLGLVDGGFTEVDGLRPGDIVVTTGGHVLKSELLKERIGSE
jgi:cobalt-zinc-cadmium efflux system membrane fusion protein